MRHLNGIYTQRYNCSEDTDGPVVRGRYKVILIEPDAYLLNKVGNHQQQDCYRAFVEAGIDEEIRKFYNNKKCLPVLDGNNFLEHIRSKLPIDRDIPKVQRLNSVPSMLTVMHAASIVCVCSVSGEYSASDSGAWKEECCAIRSYLLLPEIGGIAVKRDCRTFWYESLWARIGFSHKVWSID